jgi:hypothetical protein
MPRMQRRPTPVRGLLSIHLLVLAGLGAGGGCSDGASRTPSAAGPWPANAAEVTGPAEAPSSSLAVDLFLDGTASMSGYVSAADSRYGEFVRSLESSVRTGWRRADIRFYKFGSRVRPLRRDEVFPAVLGSAFFSERGMYEKTHIDSVVARTSRDRVSVVVTDLFQDQGDVNELVMHIQERVFSRGVEVAVLGVRSPFDGRVFDAGVEPYSYRSTPGQPATYRPFYALFFGDGANLQRLFQALAPGVEPRYFTHISPYLVRGSRVTVASAPPGRGERPTLGELAGDVDGQFDFQLVRGQSGGALDVRVSLAPRPGTPDFAEERVRLVAWRKRLGSGGAWVDSAAAGPELAAERLERTGDTLSVRVRVDLSALPPGRYAYRVTLDAGAIGALRAPAWVGELSTGRPGPAADANKTLNLDRFVGDLIRASSTVHPPKLASFVLTFRKQ